MGNKKSSEGKTFGKHEQILALKSGKPNNPKLATRQQTRCLPPGESPPRVRTPEQVTSVTTYKIQETYGSTYRRCRGFARHRENCQF